MTRKFKYLIPAIAIALMGAAFQFGGLKLDITSQGSSLSPIILSNASTQIQRVTGSANQVLKLPDATTLRAGYFYYVGNEGSGTLTISNSSSTQLVQLPAGNTTTQGAFLFLTSSATTGGPWMYGTLGGSSSGGGSVGDHEVWVYTDNGYSSKTQLWTTVGRNVGTAISYNAATGVFTINSDGIYAIEYTQDYTTDIFYGLTLNTQNIGETGTNFASVTRSAIIGSNRSNPTSIGRTIQVTLRLSTNDEVRAQSDGSAGGAGAMTEDFRIIKVAN